MVDDSITLNCKNCGAKLEVYSDMDHFACGYCGTELLVQRLSGAVALESVENAIHRVQVGTDKTAAEYALVRLTEARKPLDSEWYQVSNSVGKNGAILGGFMLALVSVIVLVLFADMTIKAVAFLLVCVGWFMIYRSICYDSERIRSLETAAKDLEHGLAQQRSIANS